MDLKTFQRRVVDEVERYLQAVAKRRAEGNRAASMDAWEDDLGLGPYFRRRNGIGEDLPTFCIKVPTGGGKTLLATQILGSAYRTIFKDRNGAGLVLWVVPTSQIYRDTLKRLRDRHDMYRQMLEHAVSRRIEVWEKHEVARLSPAKLRDCLNILVVQLASTNRQTKEDLKFFADSGGNIVEHFPPENDYDAHRKLKEKIPNLDMLAEDPATRQYLAKTSVGNLVRLCRPPVILDEGHKATSALARQTIEGFNASLVVELSATPRTVRTAGGEFRPNIICRVSGKELLDEEMIKLPLNIATSGQKDWKDVLTQARDRRQSLARKAATHAEKAGMGRLIRPMVLVQVERTGRDQREAGFIHSLDVKEYLTQTLGVPETAIKIKTAELDELSDVDNLMDPGCPVEWIITKAALQEGWDCPFAYILVSLNNTGSTTGMTQIVGRILRQPYQERTPFDELNESWVYCLHLRAGELAKAVKKALENEGLADAAGLVFDATDARALKPERVTRIRQEISGLYRAPAAGKIYLPHFCVKTSPGYERLDYFRHLLAKVDVDEFNYDAIEWPLAAAMAAAKDRFYRISIGGDILRESEAETDHIENDGAARAWIVASLSFDYLSHKQLRRIVDRVYQKLLASELEAILKDRLALVKFVVRDHIERFIQANVDLQTEAAFKQLFDLGRLVFYLECAECRFEIPGEITVRAGAPLAHDNGDLTQKSLFDFVAAEPQNSYERAVALCLDRDENVLWWYRNLVGEDSFWVQGYRRNRMHPDFVAQSRTDVGNHHLVWVVESKGKHLEGNVDTRYKRDVARFFSEVGKQVSWQQLGDEFKDHRFCFHVLDERQENGRDWKDELQAILRDSQCAGA
jgi:type III restriction enzyme